MRTPKVHSAGGRTLLVVLLMRSPPAHFDQLCRDCFGGMGWQRDRCGPASDSRTRLRRRLSLPSRTRGTNLGKNARYARENREPLHEPAGGGVVAQQFLLRRDGEAFLLLVFAGYPSVDDTTLNR